MATFDPRNYGALCNGQYVADAVLVTGTNDVTSASGKFVAGDVGKTIWVQDWADPTLSNLAQTTIASYVSATHVTTTINAAHGTNSGKCYWGHDDTAAFVAAVAAAVAVGRPQTVVVPNAASIVTGRIYNYSGSVPPNLIGEQLGWSQLMLSPNITIPGDGTGVLIQCAGGGVRFQDFTLWGSGHLWPFLAGQALVDIRDTGFPTVEGVEILEALAPAESNSMLSFRNCSDIIYRRNPLYIVNGTGGGSQMTGVKFDQSNGSIIAPYFSNLWRSMTVTRNAFGRDGNCGNGNPYGPQLSVYGGFSDETPGPVTIDVSNGGHLNIDGMQAWVKADIPANLTHSLAVDGTSKAWISKCCLGPWGAGGNGGRGLRVDAGGEVRAAMTTFRCSSTANDISVTNDGLFIDLGGNDFKNSGTAANGPSLSVPRGGAFKNLRAVVVPSQDNRLAWP
jgi:hypothetical protein